ncbi:MAG TPA: hypothetical protein ENI51_05930 [Candidatus Atribacteria bacterium]|nr:hypothetical protein [Candidatus Atribacteria bacterium]
MPISNRDTPNIIIMIQFILLAVIVIFTWGISINDQLTSQTMAMWFLVFVTLIYAYFVFYSIADVQEREEKRRKQKKKDLRNLIKAELEHNMDYVRVMKKTIEDIESLRDKRLKKYSLEDYTSCRDKIYNAVLSELGILNKSEIQVISDIYSLVNELKESYKDLRANAKINRRVDPKKLDNFVKYGKCCTNDINKLWAILSDFFQNGDYKRLEDRYNDFIKTSEVGV